MSRSMRDFAAEASTASGSNILLGIWLIDSHWVFDASGRSATVSSVLVGALIALFAAIRLASLHNSAGVSGLNLLLAFWTVCSRWALGYASNADALVNDVIAGVPCRRACCLERERNSRGAKKCRRATPRIGGQGLRSQVDR